MTSASLRPGSEIAGGAAALPPSGPIHAVHRGRILDGIDPRARVAVIVAPPGFGKTETARQLAGRSGTSVAWCELDRRAVAAERTLLDLLGRDAPERPGCVVIDGADHTTATKLWELVVELVEQDETVRVIVTGRARPELPLAVWDTRGWLARIGPADLCFATDESSALASHLAPFASEHLVHAIEHALEGWPIAVHLALLEVSRCRDLTDVSAVLRAVTEPVDEYVEHALRGIVDPAVHTMASELAVLARLEERRVEDLAGNDGVFAVDELTRRGGFVVPGPAGIPRFPAPVRAALLRRLRRTDPARCEQLVETTVARSVQTLDLRSAHELTRIVRGDQPAFDVVLRPVLLATETGRDGLVVRFVTDTPPGASDHDLAYDVHLAMARLVAGELSGARALLDRVQDRIEIMDAALQSRYHAIAGALAVLRLDLRGVETHSRQLSRLQPQPSGETSADTAVLVSLLLMAVTTGDLGRAGRLLDHLDGVAFGPGGADAMIPALRGTVLLEGGDLRGALGLAVRISELVDGRQPQLHGQFDAHHLLARCRLAIGDLLAAEAAATTCRRAADSRSYPFDIARHGVLHAEIALAGRAATIALERTDRVRAELDTPPAVLDDWLGRIEAQAHLLLGRPDLAEGTLAAVRRDDRSARIVWAQCHLARANRRAATVELEGWEGWPTPLRLRAGVVLAADRSDTSLLSELLAEGRRTGWVAPFLGLHTDVDTLLRDAPLEHLHPALGEALRRSSGGGGRTALPWELLTRREQQVLDLLPTHLTFAQLGQEIHVSVNTVKAHAKSVYRKLGVGSRGDAVAEARRRGLL